MLHGRQTHTAPRLDTPKTQNIHYAITPVKEGRLQSMRVSREYVGYLSKQILKRLAAERLIAFDQPEYVNEVITQVMLEELGVEDRINDEVRKILDTYDDQMKQMGVSYEEMFKKVKRQLVHDRNVVL